MTKCLFIHDFFQDGREDVLAEVRVLQAYGQWTKQKRASWTRQAVACYERSRYETSYRPQGSDYYAGRIVGLRSAITADYPPPRKETCGKTVFVALADEKTIFCGNCGDHAVWKYYERGDQSSIRYRCDRCKQELVRAQTAYSTSDGWDWDDDEILFPIVVQGDQPLKKDKLALAQVTFPLAMSIGFDFSNILWPVNHTTLLGEVLLVLLTCWQSKNLVRVLFFLGGLAEGGVRHIRPTEEEREADQD
jgi:predicted RNA-binding Zn-ribbon protein involved in translation (DUF1610 family)